MGNRYPSHIVIKTKNIFYSDEKYTFCHWMWVEWTLLLFNFLTHEISLKSSQYSMKRRDIHRNKCLSVLAIIMSFLKNSHFSFILNATQMSSVRWSTISSLFVHIVNLSSSISLCFKALILQCIIMTQVISVYCRHHIFSTTLFAWSEYKKMENVASAFIVKKLSIYFKVFKNKHQNTCLRKQYNFSLSNVLQ